MSNSKAAKRPGRRHPSRRQYARLDFSDAASEKRTFVRVGDRLIVLFDNQSSITIDPVFDSAGHPLSDVAFEMAPDRIATGDEFASPAAAAHSVAAPMTSPHWSATGSATITSST
jgi:hypothetical protein